LAALSEDQIAAQAKSERLLIPRSSIEKWLTEAGELAAAAELALRQVIEVANRATNEDKIPASGSTEWRSFAAFVVEFQARGATGPEEEQKIEIRHIPIDKHGTWQENGGHVDVVRGEDLYQWMLDQLGQRVHRPAIPRARAPDETRPAVASEATVPPVTVDITEIRAFQPPDAETPVAVGADRQPFDGSLKSGEPFALETTFELTGPAAADAARDRLSYHAEFQVRDLPTGVTTRLGNTESETLVESTLSYPAKLPELVLQPGMYRMQVVTMLESKPPVLSYVKVPLLLVA
jgi:hypothetical protein